jgi:hypothetical protein
LHALLQRSLLLRLQRSPARGLEDLPRHGSAEARILAAVGPPAPAPGKATPSTSTVRSGTQGH